jgi:hypothetical protein
MLLKYANEEFFEQHDSITNSTIKKIASCFASSLCRFCVDFILVLYLANNIVISAQLIGTVAANANVPHINRTYNMITNVFAHDGYKVVIVPVFKQT